MSPIGIYGTTPHVLTNRNIDTRNKVHCFAEQTKESVKDAKTIVKTATAAAGATAIITGCSINAQNFLHGLKHGTGKLLSSFHVDETNLKEIIKNTNTYEKLNALPTPAKAAIAVGVATLSIVSPLIGLSNFAKNAAIEAKHED